VVRQFPVRSHPSLILSLVTLGKNQTAFGNKRLRDNGVSEAQGRILCMDFRDLPHPKGTFNKIVSLEMAEVSRRILERRYSLTKYYSTSVFDDTAHS
jgi:cyclopropane fatty-acyl-phospholipid synthase-like methyltransferase